MLSFFTKKTNKVPQENKVPKKDKACAFFDIDHANTFFVAESTFDKNNINVICDKEKEYKPLHLAVNKKDEVAIGAIIHILSKKIKDKTLTKSVVNSQDKEGNTPLMLAVQNAIDSKTTKDYNKSYNCIVSLIFNAVEGFSNLVDVNCKSNSGDTCLMLAATYNLTDIVKLLLERKDIDVNIQNKIGITALNAAAAVSFKNKNDPENKKCVELLLKHNGIDVNLADDKGISPLVYAAHNGKIEIFELLIKQPNINPDRDYVLKNCHPVILSEVTKLYSSTEVVDKIPTPETAIETSYTHPSERRRSNGGSKNKKTKRRSNKRRKSEKKKIFN